MSNSSTIIACAAIIAALNITFGIRAAEANNVPVALDHSCNSILQEVAATVDPEDGDTKIQGFVKSQYAGAEELTFSVFRLDGVFAYNVSDNLDNGNFLDFEFDNSILVGANSIRLTRCDLGLGRDATPPTDYQWNRIQDVISLAEVICAFGLPELADVCREF